MTGVEAGGEVKSCLASGMRLRVRSGWLILLSGLLSGAVSAAKATDASFGVWRNPQDSVHVRAEPCGTAMCGVIVWANDKAKADALKGSRAPLVGSALFRNFRPVRTGVWKGRVFVPDIGKTFSGNVTAIDATHLKGSGCLLGGIGCKSQIWTRIGD